MSNIRHFIALGLLVLCHLSCKDEIDIPVRACDEVVDGWNIYSYDFPKVQGQKDLFFLNDQLGFSVGNAGTILKTSNGGKNWKILHQYYSAETGINDDALTDAAFQAVYFVSDSIGFVAGDGENDYFNDIFTDAVFLRTTNGGKQWSKVYLDGISEVYDMVFFDESNGLAIVYVQHDDYTQRYQMRATSDGGDHWTQVVLPGSSLKSRSFILTPSRILVFAENDSDVNALWSSNDQGQTWQSALIPGEKVFEIYFVNDDIGFANCTPTDFPVGYYKTIDGGATWIEQEAPFTQWSVMHFMNDREGFVINPVYEYIEQGWEGYAQLVAFEGYQTSDGGDNWDKSVVGGSCQLDGLGYSQSNQSLFILGYPSFIRFEKL